MKTSPLSLFPDEKRVLWELRTKGARPRIEIASELQLSNSAMTKLSQSLMSLGLIEEAEGQGARARGRPTVPLRISGGGGFAIGATVHKGILEIAVVDFAGGTIALAAEEVGAPQPLEFARLFEDRIHKLSVENRLLGRRLIGVGIGIPGPPLSRQGDRWSVVEELPGWREAALQNVFSETLGVPVSLENDATVAALAEYYLGGGITQFSTIVVFLLGYGIGAGVIESGRLLKGEFGGAGEIGMLYPSGGKPRPTTIDLLAILKAAGSQATSVADFEPCSKGYEPLIEQWLDRAAAQLLSTVNSAIAWFDPGEIVLSSPLPAELMRRLAERLNAAAPVWNALRPPGAIRVSDLGGSSIALGAALLPIHAVTARS